MTPERVSPRREAARVAASILLTAALLDGPAIVAAKGLGDGAVAVWRAATGIGTAAWMLALSALLGAVAWVEAARARSPLYAAGLRTLARRAAFCFAAVAAAGLASNLLKHLIGRARPKLYEEVGPFAFSPLAFDFKWNSLPSGHAATLFALATALALLAPRWRRALYAVAAVGAASRVAVAAHYPTDVIAGAALGHYGTRALAARAAARGLLFGPGLAPRAPALAAAALRRLGAAFLDGARAMAGAGRAGAAP